MSNYGKSSSKGIKKIASWDDAITDAKQRLKEIQFALSVFEERKRNGEPWPLEQQKSPQEGG